MGTASAMLAYLCLSLHALLFLKGRLEAFLDGEEHGTQLSQPLCIHSSHTLHVLASRHDELMVHHIIRRVTQSIQCRGRMQVTWHAIQHVNILANSLDARGVVEVRGTNGFSHHVPIIAARNQCHTLGFHDVKQLLTDFTRLAHRFHMHKVISAPLCAVIVALPLIKNIQKRQVIRFSHEKLLAGSVTFRFPGGTKQVDKNKLQTHREEALGFEVSA